MGINWMTANRIKVPSNPSTIFVSFNTLPMDNETLFKRSGSPNIATFTINTLYQMNDISRITCKITSEVIFLTRNSTNKCTDKDHVVFTDAAHVTTSNTTLFFSPGNWKKRGC